MSIHTDDNIDTGLSDTDAVSQLMAAMKTDSTKAKSGPEDDLDEDEELDEEADANDDDGEEDQDGPDEDEESDEDEEEDEGDEEPGDTDKAPNPAEVTDETVLKVTVDGQEVDVTVGSLKRLAGQEASLTRKSQEADLVGGRAALVLQGAIDAVLEDLAPYEGVDWVLEGQRMDPEEFAWHREQYTRLGQRYQKLVGSAKEFTGVIAGRKQAQNQDQIKEAVQVLQRDIPGWSDELYGEIMAFGVKEGLDEEDVKNITSPAVIKLLHKAMKADKAKDTAAQKITKAPNRVRKGAGREAIGDAGSRNTKALERKLASGRASDDDAIALLTGRWGVRSR